MTKFVAFHTAYQVKDKDDYSTVPELVVQTAEALVRQGKKVLVINGAINNKRIWHPLDELTNIPFFRLPPEQIKKSLYDLFNDYKRLMSTPQPEDVSLEDELLKLEDYVLKSPKGFDFLLGNSGSLLEGKIDIPNFYDGWQGGNFFVFLKDVGCKDYDAVLAYAPIGMQLAEARMMIAEFGHLAVFVDRPDFAKLGRSLSFEQGSIYVDSLSESTGEAGAQKQHQAISYTDQRISYLVNKIIQE